MPNRCFRLIFNSLARCECMSQAISWNSETRKVILILFAPVSVRSLWFAALIEKLQRTMLSWHFFKMTISISYSVNSTPLTIACKFKFKLLLNIGLCAGFTYHPKLRPSGYRSATEMVFTQEMQRIDREFYIPNDYDPLFSLKINGKVLWTWPEFKIDPTQINVSCLSEWFGVNRSAIS